MTDDTHLLTRRNALKGLGAFAGTSAAGTGAMLHASQPAVASGHLMSVDDLTIELVAERGEAAELAEIGISDIWFEVEWENIEYGLYAELRISKVQGFVMTAPLGDVNLGIDRDGTETFGYGEAYESLYNVDLDGPSYLAGAAPLNINRIELPESNLLDEYRLEALEDEITVPSRISLYLVPANEQGSLVYPVLSGTQSDFDITLERAEPDAGTNEGEADVYGED